MKIRLMDDTTKTMLIDDSLTVLEMVDVIAQRIDLKNPEEFSLQVRGHQSMRLPVSIVLSPRAVRGPRRDLAEPDVVSARKRCSGKCCAYSEKEVLLLGCQHRSLRSGSAPSLVHPGINHFVCIYCVRFMIPVIR